MSDHNNNTNSATAKIDKTVASLEKTTQSGSWRLFWFLVKSAIWLAVLIGATVYFFPGLSWLWWAGAALWGLMAVCALAIYIFVWRHVSKVVNYKEGLRENFDVALMAKAKLQQFFIIFIFVELCLIGVLGWLFYKFPGQEWILWVGGGFLGVVTLIMLGIYSFLSRQLQRVSDATMKVLD